METSVVRRRKRSASAERIKNAYNGANNVEVEVIEAVGAAKTDDTPKEMRVCAYCRVSTEEESQQSSYELQVQHYTQYINDHENWTLQGIYADEGISGTSVMHRKQFLLMIEECKAGNINLIVTKSICSQRSSDDKRYWKFCAKDGTKKSTISLLNLKSTDERSAETLKC